MSKLLSDLDEVVCLMDDVLVHGRTASEHDEHLEKVLQKAGMTLNKDKCQFLQQSIMFLGQLIDSSGNQTRSRESEGNSKYANTKQRNGIAQVLGNA